MPDMEKVIKGLEVCTSKPCYCMDCPYKANCCLDSQEIMEDALTLLKKQNVSCETSSIEIEGGGSTWWHVCEECRGAVDVNDKYCRHCGRRFTK